MKLTMKILSAAGYRHYLNKPFDGSTLLETVKKAYPISLEKKIWMLQQNAIDLGLDLTGLQKDVVSNISSQLDLNDIPDTAPTNESHIQTENLVL